MGETSLIENPAPTRKVAIAKLATTMATENRLKTLPDIDRLKSLCQSLAMLDAIMSPDWEYRYYSFDSKWDLTEMMASMRNGQGDDFFILFNNNGAIIKGFDHESPMSPYAHKPKRVWPGVLDDVPDVFRNFLDEPAFTIEDTTFCLWRLADDSCWRIGNIAYPRALTRMVPTSCWPCLMESLRCIESSPRNITKGIFLYPR